MFSVVARRIARRPVGIHPALWNFAEECRDSAARLIAYVGALALIAIVTIQLWDQLPLATALEPVAKATWNLADRSHPAFALSQLDSSGKTETYEIFRHPEGGRKDVLRWAASPTDKPIAELELYRPGTEVSSAGPPAADIAARMDPDGMREIAGEGIIDSKFGPVALLGFADRANDAKAFSSEVDNGSREENASKQKRRCLGFMKNLEAANLRISGWSCQGDTLPARRAAIACTLSRLTLLTAGNDRNLAELFARAELKRGSCAPAGGATASSPDWVTGAQNPRLRGSL
jgi:hypothetical protein